MLCRFQEGLDTIPRSTLWQVLKKTGVGPRILKALQAMYSNDNTTTTTDSVNRSEIGRQATRARHVRGTCAKFMADVACGSPTGRLAIRAKSLGPCDRLLPGKRRLKRQTTIDPGAMCMRCVPQHGETVDHSIVYHKTLNWSSMWHVVLRQSP